MKILSNIDLIPSASGDILYGGATIFERLPIGMSGQVLTVVNNTPAWATPLAGSGTISGSGLADPTTTTGDIIYRDVSGITRLGIGSSSQVLGVVAGKPAWVTASGSGGGGGGADSVTTGTVGVVIPGLAGSPDVAGRAGSVVSYEFDSGPSPFTWSVTTPAVEDINTTVPSAAYIKTNSGASEHFGSIPYAPAGAFDLRAKIHMGAETDAFSTPSFYFFVTNTARTERIFLGYQQQSSRNGQGTTYTYNGSGYDQKRVDNIVLFSLLYFRITGDGSGNFVTYFSTDGVMWWRWVAFSYTITIQQMGVWLTSAPLEVAIDWIRAS